MTQLIRKAIRELVADKRKLSAALCLTAMVMLLWGRLMLKQLPRNAVADPPHTPQAADSSASERPVAAEPTRTPDGDAVASDPANNVNLHDSAVSDGQSGKSAPNQADHQQRLD